MRSLLREGSNDIESERSTPANRGASLCVSFPGTDALGCYCEAMFMTEQGLATSSAPEAGGAAMMLPGLDATGALICKQSL
jgi:hypothetical protein